MSSFEIHTMFGRARAGAGPCAAAAGTMPKRIANAKSDRRVRLIIASDLVKRYAYRPAGELPRLRRSRIDVPRPALHDDRACRPVDSNDGVALALQTAIAQPLCPARSVRAIVLECD